MSKQRSWQEMLARQRRAGKVEATLMMLAADPDCVLWCVSQERADEWIARGVPADRVKFERANGSRITFRSLEEGHRAGLHG